MTRRASSELEFISILQGEDIESESALSDQGSEVSDHLSCIENTDEEVSSSSLDEDDVPLSQRRNFFTGRDKVTKWKKSNNNRVRRQVQKYFNGRLWRA